MIDRQADFPPFSLIQDNIKRSPVIAVQSIGPIEAVRKRILYLSVYDPHVPLTGAGTRGAQFVSRLASRLDLDLIYLDGSGQPPIRELSEKYEGRLTQVRSKIKIPFRKFAYFIFSRELYGEACRLMLKNAYDFVFCDYGLSAIYGLLLSRKFKVPFIYCSHNIEYKGYLDKSGKDVRRLALLPYVYIIERMGVRDSAILVPISSGDASYFSRWADSSKMVTIPQGFDDTIYNPYYNPARNDPKIVLFCGNYNIQFNRDVVRIVRERIVQRVLDVRPNTEFVFVGANPPKEFEHVAMRFLGFVEDYPSLLKNADVFISPMQQGRGFPTKIVEALACGKPTIATPVGARAIEEAFESLHICQTDEFPDRICRVLDSDQPVRTTDFAKLKQHYSWDGNVQRLVDKIVGSTLVAGHRSQKQTAQ